MNKKSDYILHPTKVSELEPVYDNAGNITAWGITVTFKNSNIEPPHAKGARVTAKSLGNETLAEYRFSESILLKGLEKAVVFRDAMSKQIARLGEER